MRELTLNEKISIKGVLAGRGIKPLPWLTMRSAQHFWGMTFGPRTPISLWYLRKGR